MHDVTMRQVLARWRLLFCDVQTAIYFASVWQQGRGHNADDTELNSFWDTLRNMGVSYSIPDMHDYVLRLQKDTDLDVVDSFLKRQFEDRGRSPTEFTDFVRHWDSGNFIVIHLLIKFKLFLLRWTLFILLYYFVNI